MFFISYKIWYQFSNQMQSRIQNPIENLRWNLSNARLKLAKNQENAKQHPQAELLLFENYSHYSSTLSSKINSTYSKK